MRKIKVYKNTKLFFSRISFISRLITSLWLNKRLRKEERLRLFFERAGGAFIKLGQILALRQDLLPQNYTDELLTLWSSVPALPFSVMRQVFFRDRGIWPEQAFDSIATEPIASASIAQVYRAQLKTGEQVAVKIRRPGVARIFETDFVVASFLTGAMGMFRFFDALQLDDVVAEFVSSTRRELDFRYEAQNADTLYRHSARHSKTIIPRIYSEHSSARVLVSEYMADILPIETIMLKLEVDSKYRQTLRSDLNIDLEEMSYYFIFDNMRQYFIDGFFHADPHPANVFLLSDNRLGYFDFGIMGEAGPERLELLHVVYGIANHDLHYASKYFFSFAKRAFAKEIEVIKDRAEDKYYSGKEDVGHYLEILERVEEIMIENFQNDLNEMLRPLYEGRKINVFKLIRRAQSYGINLPREIVMFFRTWVMAEMIALKLNPNFDMLEGIRRFFRHFPIEVSSQIIKSESHHAELAQEIDTWSHLSFEQLMEIKEADRMQWELARERLSDLLAYYAERYEEVRKLLSEK